MIYDIQNLSIGYSSGSNQKILFSDINMQIDEGNLVCLIGPNGIGKSTFLRTISGFHKQLAGSVKLFGKDVYDYSKHELALHLSVVLTEKVETRMMTVLELFTFGRYPYTNWLGKITAEDEKEIENALCVTETEYLVNRQLFELSDGELQKVMIGRSLVQSTPVIVLDEPTSHLDLKNKAEVLALLLNLSREHKRTIVVATHEIELALQLADHLILMGADKFFFTGTPKQCIEKGLLSKLFHDEKDLIRFDKATGKFLFNLQSITRT